MFIFLLLLFAVPTYGGAFFYNFSTFSTTRGNLQVVIIQQSPIENQSAAESYVRYAHGWYYNRLADHYPQLPASFFGRMRAKDPVMDGRSSMIVIYQGNPSNILAIMRFAYATPEKPETPGELFTSFRYERGAPDLVVREVIPRYGLHQSTQNEITGIWDGQERKQATTLLGGITEIKNTMVATHRFDLLPVLLHFSLKTGLYDAGLLFIKDGSGNQRYYTEEDRLAIEREMEARFKAIDNGRLSESEKEQEMTRVLSDIASKYKHTPVLTKEIVLFCNASLVPYYQQLGFELAVPGAIEGENYTMRMSRDKFENMGVEKLLDRPGVSLIREAQIQHTHPALLRSREFLDLFASFSSSPSCPGLF